MPRETKEAFNNVLDELSGHEIIAYEGLRYSVVISTGYAVKTLIFARISSQVLRCPQRAFPARSGSNSPKQQPFLSRLRKCSCSRPASCRPPPSPGNAIIGRRSKNRPRGGYRSSW